jgi:hypothetical protein
MTARTERHDHYSFYTRVSRPATYANRQIVTRAAAVHISNWFRSLEAAVYLNPPINTTVSEKSSRAT